MVITTNTTSTAVKPKLSSLRILLLTPSTLTEVPNIVTQPSSIPGFLEAFTGTRPSQDITSFAGYTSHPYLTFKTKYYERQVSLWCDELPPDTPSTSTTNTQPNQLQTTTASTNEETESKSTFIPIHLSDWQEQILDENRDITEVRASIGAIILLLPSPSPSGPQSQSSIDNQLSSWFPYIETATALRERIENETGIEVGSAIVLQDLTNSENATGQAKSSSISSSQQQLLESLEDLCVSTHGIFGWEILSTSRSNSDNTSNEEKSTLDENRTEYEEKTGIPRLIEVLESVDWTVSPLLPEYDDDDEDDDLDFLNDIDDKNANNLDLDFDISSTTTATPSAITSLIDSDETQTTSTTSTKHPPPQTTTTTPQPGLETETLSSNDDDDEANETDITNLQSLMTRVMNIREIASGITNEQERKSFAKREIGRVMREL